MKAIYKNIALAALALSAVACTQEEDFAPSYLNDPDAVRITAQVATGNVTGGFTRSNPLGTTEAEQKAFNSGDAIAVTADNQDAVTYTFNGTTWTPEEGKYLKWVADEMTFTAWYPAGKNNASATTFNVPTGYTEESPIAAADYMVYSGTQNKTNGNGVTLPMKRKMARIVITPILNDEFPETNYSITDIKVHANTSGYANGEPQTGDIQVSALKQGNAYYALLAPTTAADATFLTVTVTKTDDSTSQNLTVKGIPATEAGKSYEYTLTVGKDKATIGNVTVADWGTSQEITGGVAEWVNACFLPKGSDFNAAITAIPNSSDVTAIEFVANLSDAEMDDATSFSANNMPPNAKYKIIAADGTNPKTLKICTDAEVFMFNADCSHMFQYRGNYLNKITSIKFNNCVNTENVMNMYQMFGNSNALKELDLSCFVTSNVINMEAMFTRCHNLTSLDIRNFNVNKVTNFSSMFYRVGNSLASGKTKIYVANPNPFADKENTSINSDETKAEYVVVP